MYPIHLEKALESLWKVEFERYTKKLKAELFRLIELGEKKTVQDSDFSVRWDADLPREVIEFFARRRESKLRGQSPGSLGRSTSQKVLAQLLGWANTQVSTQLESQSSAMKMPAGAISERQTFSESQKRNFRVPALGLSPSALGQYLSDHGRHLQNLQATLFQEHENSLQNVVMGHLKKGERISTLKESIERQMDVDSSKAAFWARDQAGKFYGSVNREAQIRAGFTGYIWRTMKDTRVRDSHSELEGKFFTWNNPPLVGSQHYHPGEDYNCRCYAEPARDPGVSRDPIRVLGGPDPQPQGLQRNLQPREQGNGEVEQRFDRLFSSYKSKEISGALNIPLNAKLEVDPKKVRDQLLRMKTVERKEKIELLTQSTWDEVNRIDHNSGERFDRFMELFKIPPAHMGELILKDRKFERVFTYLKGPADPLNPTDFSDRFTAAFFTFAKGKKILTTVAWENSKIKTCFLIDSDLKIEEYLWYAIEIR